MKKKRFWLLGFGSMLMIFALACSANSSVGAGENLTNKQGEAVLTGQLLSALEGQPVEGALIKLWPGGQKAASDHEGRFAFPGLWPGAYRLEITAENYQTLEVKQVFIISGETVFLEYKLFAAPRGKTEASLEIITSQKNAEGYSYYTPVYLNASGTKNVAQDGFRWEIYNRQGELLEDPYSGKPLQLRPSAMPGASPYTFGFEPPEPGEYIIKLFAGNHQYPGEESSAQVSLKAVNTPPEAVVSAFPGPEPPRKDGAGGKPASKGLTVMNLGEETYLRGWGLDENMPAPEIYNPGGNEADRYGKNHDQYQRQFGWQWTLQFNPDASGVSGSWQDVTGLLQDASGNQGAKVQYPGFKPERPGLYRVWLSVEDRDASGSLKSLPVPLDIIVLEDGLVDEQTCLGCHGSQNENWHQTAHAGAQVSCQTCHGPGKLHLEAAPEAKKATIAVSYRSGTCGTCHPEYGDWTKSRHSDGYAYGYKEIAEPLLLNCTKCHYPEGFAEAVEQQRSEAGYFSDFQFKKPGPDGKQLIYDFSKLPAADGAGISCVSCHDAHPVESGLQAGLRAGTNEHACNTCHEEKWQNVVVEGTAAQSGSGYEYTESEDEFNNPHNTLDKCVLCHMDNRVTAADGNGKLLVGGHTLRMRDAGPNGIIGGFGPRADDLFEERNPAETDDVLNIEVCLDCHSGARDFNINGVQQRIYEKWVQLGELLKERNGGILPDYRPGDKCATCHRGGTQPFANDPDLELENAYTNYKLIKNDRSWGIHNVQYVEKLLDDSIAALQK